MKIADLYIRVSTDEQADKGYSQRNQQNILLRYCEINNIQVRHVILEDFSAKTFVRPEWKKLLAELNKSKNTSNLLLFTKWDRFSRNTSDAYMMIRVLRQLGIEPQAIEQPLDLSIPENKMMLAVYLTTPEIENDRRGLNVKEGLRQARKEGRWMGVALPGYVNKTTDSGIKYIALSQPQASHMKWAFEKLAEGQYSIAEIWRMARERGLKNKISSFRDAIKNVGYCGKISVPANKYESAYLVQGQHEPLISEVLFYKVQDILSGRKKASIPSITKKVLIEELPLRGFLNCTKCSRSITGSASKGNAKHFHYYHCQSSCKIRYPAAKVNDSFIRKLQEFIPLKGSAKHFKQVILEMCKDGSKFQKAECQELICQISENNNRITKARELLMEASIDANDYKIIKKETEDKIVRLEAMLNEVISKKTDSTNQVEKLIDAAIDVLKVIDTVYFVSSIETKKKIISSTFPEKWVFDGAVHRTGLTNSAAELMRQINKELGNKKSRATTNIRHVHGSVPSADSF